MLRACRLKGLKAFHRKGAKETQRAAKEVESEGFAAEKGGGAGSECSDNPPVMHQEGGGSLRERTLSTSVHVFAK
ncbi:hypothetical protein GCM10028811_15930 [Uliginosibacterium sediminicola]